MNHIIQSVIKKQLIMCFVIVTRLIEVYVYNDIYLEQNYSKFSMEAL